MVTVIKNERRISNYESVLCNEMSVLKAIRQLKDISSKK